MCRVRLKNKISKKCLNKYCSKDKSKSYIISHKTQNRTHIDNNIKIKRLKKTLKFLKIHQSIKTKSQDNNNFQIKIPKKKSNKRSKIKTIAALKKEFNL